MTVDLYRPFSLRHNDIWLLNSSNLNGRLLQLQLNNPVQLTIYVDSIFPRLSNLHSSWKDDVLEEWKVEGNSRKLEYR